MNNRDAIDAKIKALKLKLTLRYILALSLIACTLLFAFFTLNTQLKQSEKDAHIINISGMQRMLSQRIALFSREIYHAENATQGRTFADKMDAAVKRMRANHEHLISSSDMGEEMRAIYYGDIALAQRVERYIALSEMFLEAYEQGGLRAVRARSEMNDIVAIARNGLLRDLDMAVSQYQVEAEKNISFFKQTEIIVVLVGLSLLLIEALFIFRPMVRRVSESMRSLHTQNDELIEFSYRISHDLRAPIVSSLGLASVARNAVEGGQDETAQTAIDHIEKSMVKLEALISDIINLTKTKLTRAESEPVDCAVLVEDVLEKLSSLDGFQNIDIRKTIEIDQPIIVQKILLQQSLSNLISNSIKYKDPQEEQPYISITINEGHGMIHVHIGDNGLGVPEKFRERLFSMFERFHPEHSFGSGLGLYLVRQNVEALGGSVKYVGTDEGSVFKFSFPVKEHDKGDTV